MASFNKFLKSFSSNVNTKGEQFEYFVRWFLKNDNYWRSLVDKVWLFEDAPINWGGDIGTDLIFLDKNKKYWAVQAKFYNSNYSIKKSDIDSFLSDTNRKEIYSRLLITTTNQFSPQGIKTIKSQEKKTQIFSLIDFDNSGFNYPKSFSRILKKPNFIKISARNHQKLAIKNVYEGFKTENKGQLIMACGTGKTLTCYWIHQKLNSSKTLILVPSLNLLSQTIREWYKASPVEFKSLSVCSDPSTIKNIKEDDILVDPSELPYSTTWELNEIKEFLKTNKNYVIFATYQSSWLIAKVQEKLKTHIFDLSIADEAHKCTGSFDKEFSIILDDNKIKSKKKLFTTATPKVFSSNIKKQAEIKSIELVDMNDYKIFGKKFYNYSFSQAIKNKQLADYRIVLFGVKKQNIKNMIDQRQFLKIKKNFKTDAMSLASQVALLKSIKEYKLNKIISFHGNIEKAKKFKDSFPQVNQWARPNYKTNMPLNCDYVSGNMATYSRKIKLDILKQTKKNEVGVLSNSKCLGEGVDVPTLDGIIFFDPKRSEVDIIQSVGRAIRKPQNVRKNYGYICIPVFIEGKEISNKTIEKSNFKPVFQILNALRSHDESLKIEIDNLKLGLGKKGVLGGSRKIIFDVPFKITKSFQDQINTLIINRIPNDWDFYLNLLKKYVNENKTSLISQNKIYKDISIGSWTNRQRSNYHKNLLSQYQINELEKFEDWSWSLKINTWNKNYLLLNDYVKKNKKIPKIYTKIDNKNIGIWVGHQRAFYRKNKLSKERISKLEKIDLWKWDYSPDEQFKIFFNQLLAYYKKNKTSHIERKRVEKNIEKKSLAAWIGRIRSFYQQGKLDKNKAKLFENTFHDWFWDFLDYQWMNAFNLLIEYDKKYNSTTVPLKFRKNNIGLGSWVQKQRANYKDNIISKFRINKLDSLENWYWDEDKKNEMLLNEILKKLKNYYKNKTVEFILKDLWFYSNKELEKIVDTLRRQYKQNILPEEFVESLEKFKHWTWKPLDTLWFIKFDKLKKFYEQNNHSNPISRSELGGWIKHQKERYKSKKLEKDRIKLLESTFHDWLWK